MTTAHDPTQAAKELGVSTSTLRRWSLLFSDYLSPEAESPLGGGKGNRRYTPEDIQFLSELQSLLDSGMNVDDVRVELESRATQSQTTAEAEDVRTAFGAVVESAEALVVTGDEGPDIGQVVAATLASLSDSQQIILTGQQTSRQLLGVLLQDNFNLKEENVRLRERMVDTERQVFEMKRALDEARSEERERMRQMEAQLFELQRRLDAMSQQRAAARPNAATAPAPMPVVVHGPAPASSAPQPAVQTPQEVPTPQLATNNETPASPPTPDSQTQPTNNESPPQKRGFWQRLFGG